MLEDVFKRVAGASSYALANAVELVLNKRVFPSVPDDPAQMGGKAMKG